MPARGYGRDEDTVAVLVAGRAITHELAMISVAQVEQLRELAAQHEHAVVVPVDDLNISGEGGPDALTHGRIAIGLEIAVARADAGRPIVIPPVEELRASVGRSRELIGPEFWQAVAEILGPPDSPGAGADVREASSGYVPEGFIAGMCFDSEELLASDNALFLATTGALPLGALWYGVARAPEDGLLDQKIGEGELGYAGGQGPGQQPHREWVYGVHVVTASFDSEGVMHVPIDDQAHAERAQIAAELDSPGYLLLARYD